LKNGSIGELVSDMRGRKSNNKKGIQYVSTKYKKKTLKSQKTLYGVVV